MVTRSPRERCCTSRPRAAGRRRAWEKVNGVEIPAENFHVLAQPVQLASSEGEELQDACLTGSYIFVVTDTQARCTVGPNENDARDMGIVAEVLGALARASGAAVLVVHHDGKDAILRGSTAVPAAADTILLTKQSGGIFTLSSHKQKNMADTPDMHFRLETADLGVTDKWGNPITNAAMVETAEVPSARLSARDETVERIRAARDEHPDWSRRRVAKELDIPPTTVHRRWTLAGI